MKRTDAPLRLVAPVSGWALPLAEVPDPVFAGGMLGDGVAIDPVEAALCAPCDGLLLSVAPTGHAVTLRADNGAELLLHVGIDTVGLRGNGFEALASAGRRVRAGDALLRFDLEAVARLASSLVSPLVVTNAEGFEILRRTTGRAVARGDSLMELRARPAAPAAQGGADGAAVSREIVVTLPHGIHARPAALLARQARSFGSDAQIASHGRTASARSAVSLMALGVRHGDRVILKAAGADAAAVLDALAPLLCGDAAGRPAGPGHEDAAAPASVPATPAAGAKLPGIAAAPGLALGVAAPLQAEVREVSGAGAGIARETEELARALDAVRLALAVQAKASSGPPSEILAAHLELLDDPALADSAADSIRSGRSAGYAWRSAIHASADALRGLGDPRLAERADDLLDLEGRVLSALAGDGGEPEAALPERAIVLADQLLPSRLMALDPGRIAGICTARGGPTSHVAILAAAIGKPMLVGAGPGVLGIAAGTPLLLDAGRGWLQVDPPAADATAAERRLREVETRGAAERAAARFDCRTADGARIEVYANLGSAAEAAEAVALGAEGCGLLRTEFLFLERLAAPDARSQADEYRRVLDAFGDRPVVIRTLDAGNDKPIRFLAASHEANPALGLRGVRAGLRHPELLRTQLEAVLSLRAPGRCRLMLPMVHEPGEVARVRALLEELAARLGVDGRPALGVMVETPSAAVIADRICEAADFVSIGTNDLTQYTLAMDRTHPDLATQLDGLHPAVLRLVRATVEAAAAHDRPVAVCGSLAGDPVAVPLLLGLGVQELSLVPRAIPHIKALVRECRLPQCRELAQRALEMDSAAAVRELVRRAPGAPT